MLRSSRLVPALLLLGLAILCFSPAVRAQSPDARFAFADTTLLRDTLDLHFDGLFELADSLRITPDSLRAYAIRYRMPLDRLVFLSDSLGAPVDSVGTVFAREQFNPLSRSTDRLTSFRYESTYTPARQSSAWGNTVSADLVRGPATLHNVTIVRIDRIRQGSTFGFTRSNTSSTETGWRFSPNLSAGARVNYLRAESDQLGSKRVTQNSDFQGSLRGRAQFARYLAGDLNLFGGPFNEPTNSLSSGSKQGIGTQLDGRLQYSAPGWVTFDTHGTSNLKLGNATVPARDVRFQTHDLKYDVQGNVSMWPTSPASVTVSYTLGGDHIERVSTSTQFVQGPGGPTDVDTIVVDRLLTQPSGTVTVEAAAQLQGTTGSLTVTSSISRATTLLASERVQGLVIDRSLSRGVGFGVNGQISIRGWSFDAQFSEDRPTDENPRATAVNVPRGDGTFDAVQVDYREKGRVAARSLSGQIARSFTPRFTLRARGNVALTQNRYSVASDDYLATTNGVEVKPGDPSDNYRQSYRIEGTYAPSSRFSTTLGLQVSRVATLLLDALRSIANREDRVYSTEWVWTYRLLNGLTANQRNQILATYSHNIYVPQNDRLAMSYTTVTTLNATLTKHLSADLTHNTIYGPNGGYAPAIDGLQYFSLSDATRDYTLSGRLNYTPDPAFTLTLFPTYRANKREDRTAGTQVTTSSRGQLDISAGASLNMNVTKRSRLTGTINRNFNSRRDVSYKAGIPTDQPRSVYDFWSGSLNFSWNL